MPIYPNCQLMDLTDYFELNASSLLSVSFVMQNTSNVGLSLNILNKNRVSKRKLASAMVDYLGPTMRIEDISSGTTVRIILHCTQEIFSEKDENAKCKNYPNKFFKDYKECDQKFVYKEVVENLNLTPFWLTDDFKLVTKLRNSYM